MERSEGLANEAIAYLDLAQKYESENNVSKAIENYQLAAESLKKSGFLIDRISDIYTRIEELKKLTQQESAYQHAQLKAQVEEIQNQAFSILDTAQNFEKRHQFEDAVSQYISAINLLVQAGWTTSQLENLRDKVANLNQKIEQQKHMKQDIKLETVEAPPQLKILEENKAQITDAFGTIKTAEKAEELRKYKERKSKEDQIQNDAFTFIDNAKFYEREKKYDEAIDSYVKAIELLNSIGWREQTKNLQIIVEKLKNDKYEYERFLEQQKLESFEILDNSKVKEQAKERRFKAIEFADAKREEEAIQTEAFNLIEFGKKLDREKKYDKAIASFQKSIQLLKSVGWDSYIQPLMNLINDINKKLENDQDFEDLRKKRDNKLELIQNTIFIKEREELVQTAKDLELRRTKYEEERKKIEVKETEFYQTLDKADSILKEGADFDSAITEYKKALEHLKNLGPGWESYIDTINSTIQTVQKLKEAQIERTSKEQKKIEETQQSELDFQAQISLELDKERAKIKKRDTALQLRKDEMEYLEDRKKEAFKALEEAQNFINEGKLENAIQAYQNAGIVFAGIQWNDELHIIENAIKEIENRIESERIQEQREIEKSIEQHKKEQEFQAQIAKQLQEERERLKQKQVILREREKEIEFREARKQEAFKILERAQIQLDQGNFDDTIKLYRKATKIFAEIQWYDEVESIGNAIVDIESKRYEAELQKQKTLQSILEKERKDKEFQDRIIRDMNVQRDILKQKGIVLRERESELEFREMRKNEAFKIIDEAQNYLSLGKFDLAIESYRIAANIFAQIQWEDEIPLINQAIIQIEEKKKEKELWKQKTIQDAINKETAYKHFIDKVQRQREIERIKTQREKELLEKKKMMTNENLAKQEKILKEIEEADILIQQEKYDDSIRVYKRGIEVLQDLGWTGSYLNLLKETLQSIQQRKREKDLEQQRQEELIKKHEEEERKFQQKIEEQMQREHKRLLSKSIEIQERETRKRKMEESKLEAFDLMDSAEVLMNKKDYRNAIKNYNQAALILREIQFPTESIEEMIQKVQEKQIKEELNRKKESERTKKAQEEEKTFKERIAEKMRNEELKMKEKQIKLQEQEERKQNLENVRIEAFNLLENAEISMNQGNLEKSLEFYHKADLKLAEIQFPSDLIKQMKEKLQEKIRERDIQKQRDLEKQLEREKEDRYQERQINELMIREKRRLNLKKEDLAKQEQFKEAQNKQLQLALNYLEEAQDSLRLREFDNAIKKYQDAGKIFTELGWEDELPLVQNSIREVTRQKFELKKYLEQEEAKKLKKEQEDKKFRDETLELMAIEKETLEKKKLELRERERELQYLETRKEIAFKVLDEARDLMDQGKFDEAIKLYYQVETIFAEIQWFDEIQIIHNSILEIERQKRENIIAKQRELNQQLLEEKEEELFQSQTIEQMNAQKMLLQQREIKLRAHEEELEFREFGKQEAFKLLDKAQNFLTKGDLDNAKQTYQNVIQIFAEIQWTEEIPLIQQSILSIENQKKEKEILKQREMEQSLKEEATNKEYLQHIQYLREEETKRLRREEENILKIKEKSAQNLKAEEKAFEILANADESLKREEFENSTQLYAQAIGILEDIGWEREYLSLLQDTLEEIKIRKQEKEKKVIHEREVLMKQLEEEKQLEKQIVSQFEIERKRLEQKQFEIKKQEDLKKHFENRREDAFKLMDKGEVLINEGNYDEAIKQYYEAELILNEISFPTNAVQEMIEKVKGKKIENEITKQQEIEAIHKKEDDEREFLNAIAESMRYKEEKMRNKQIIIRRQEELRAHMEKRKEDAFELLEEAETFVKQANYDKALEYYKSAELILNEVQFPTDSLNELIAKVSEKRRLQEINKQKEIEFKLQKEREEREFQRKITEELIREKSRLKFKQIEIKKLEEASNKIEKKKEDAFAFLDKAESLMKNKSYDQSIEAYRKALIILNEIRYPTDSIEAMINKVNLLKKAKQEEENMRLKQELERIEEEKNLNALVQERKKQEAEKKAAKQLALQQKEKLIQDRLTFREAAYSLLEEGSKYLKLRSPDYDKAVSLYLQARDLLSDKIGWEPEINNLNQIIKDLVQEKASLKEKLRLEEEVRIKRQREYELFQQEIRNQRMEYELKQREHQKKLKQLYEKQQHAEIIKEEGLSLIDEAKQLAAAHDFNAAYKNFHIAMDKFKEIGWDEQTKYIQKEIKNTRDFEEKVKKQEIGVQKIYENLEKKKQLEKVRKEEEEMKLRETAGELVEGLSKLIKERSDEDMIQKLKEAKKAKTEAKIFSKDMKSLLNLKQELTQELKSSHKISEIEREKEQLARDKEKADEIKEMLKKVSKKSKK